MKKSISSLIIFYLSLFNTQAQSALSAEEKEMFKKMYEISIKSEIKFEAVQKQIEDLKISINQRFESQEKLLESQDKRLDTQDKRLGDLWNMMAVLLAGILGSIAYMYWDRRSANEPLKIKQEEQEKELTSQKQDISRLDTKVKQLMDKAAML